MTDQGSQPDADRLIDQLLQAIDEGRPVDVDISEIIDDEQRRLIESLKKIARVSSSIQQQIESCEIQVEAGDTWGPLRIMDRIGSGGLGVVYRAFDQVLDRVVAVKFLKPESRLYLSDAQFLDEARNMAMVRHPNVLAVHGGHSDRGLAGYWTEFLDGDVLYDRLQSETLGWSESLKMAAELARAVQAIHQNELVHGDIKSLNVMLQPGRGAILLDFGSSVSLSDKLDRSDKVFSGTPVAMAPEQTDQRQSTFSSDIFCLGLLFFELSADKHPLSGLSRELIEGHLKSLSSLTSSLSGPARWRRLLAAMLHVDPESRPDIETVVTELETIESAPRRRARHFAVGTVMSLLALVALIAIVSRDNILDANRQTETINDILSGTFLSVAPYSDGSNVKLVDALSDAESRILGNPLLNESIRQDLLVRIDRTYLSLSEHDRVISLANTLLTQPTLSVLNKMKVWQYQADVHSDQGDYATSNQWLKRILDQPADTVATHDEHLSALASLFFNQLQLGDLDSLPDLLTRIENVKPQSSMRLSALGELAYNEGAYYDALQQHQQAHDAYVAAAGFYEQNHHAEYYGVLTSLSQAAQAKTRMDDTQAQREGLAELEALLPRMLTSMGEDHGHVINTRLNLGYAYLQSDEFESATETFESMQSVIDRVYGKNSLYSLGTLRYYLTIAQANAGALKEAALEFADIINALQTHHDDQPEVLIKVAMTAIWFYYDTQGDLNSATNLCDVALDLAEKRLEPNHAHTGLLKQYRALIDHSLGDEDALTRAIALHEEHTKRFSRPDQFTSRIAQKLQSLSKQKPD